MTKEDHIKYWLDTSKKDWNRAELLVRSKDYVFALFCLHLSVEKLAKALWVKEYKENFPPKIHNLITLFSKTSLKVSEEQAKLLNNLNFFQIEGRYPDYTKNVQKVATLSFTKKLFEQAKELKQCVQKKVQ